MIKLNQLFQSKYKNRIINKINELEKSHSVLLKQTKENRFSNPEIWVKTIMQRERIAEDIKLLKSLLN